MKELPILFLIFMFLLLGENSFAADPECGLWIAGPGTYMQTACADGVMRANQNPANEIKVTGICSGFCGELPMYEFLLKTSSCDDIQGFRVFFTVMGRSSRHIEDLQDSIGWNGDVNL